MKRGWIILGLGLLACVAAFSGFYHVSTASHRAMLKESSPELAWLKKEFHLSDEDFARIAQLHAAYLPQCQKRCRIIEEQNEKLQQLLATNTTVTAETENLLSERAKTRAECEATMLKHFLEVSRAMPPEQGRRYLAWVQEQTFLRGQGMEKHHQPDPQHR
jgi:Spy/CpxP family protein refolding chaperone